MRTASKDARLRSAVAALTEGKWIADFAPSCVGSSFSADQPASRHPLRQLARGILRFSKPLFYGNILGGGWLLQKSLGILNNEIDLFGPCVCSGIFSIRHFVVVLPVESASAHRLDV
jgi:hypothetical protein